MASWGGAHRRTFHLRHTLCTHSTRTPRRTLTVCPRLQPQALQRAKTEDFKAFDARRASVEGTISQGVRVMGLRRSRSIGQEKTHLQHVATAAAMNIVRLMRWLDGNLMLRRGARPWFSCFVTLSFSKSLVMHEVCLHLFLHRYNLEQAIMLM
jgi:Transposase DDE domain